jgi:hypothetical protein
MKLPLRVLGILVVYTAEHAERAIAEFAGLVNAVSRDHVLVVVNNNPTLREAPTAITVIEGSNRLAEFSGWDEGLAWAHEKATGAFDAFVFANDTFCFHRRWNRLDAMWFARVVRATDPHDPTILGQVDMSHDTYRICGASSRTWVSTYLFALTRAAMDSIGGRIAPPPETTTAWVPGTGAPADEDRFFSEAIDPALRAHLQRWLFASAPVASGPRWRNAAPLTEHNWARFRLKAQCILSEKCLSSRVVAAGGTLTPALPFPPKDALAKLRDRIVDALRRSSVAEKA